MLLTAPANIRVLAYQLGILCPERMWSPAWFYLVVLSKTRFVRRIGVRGMTLLVFVAVIRSFPTVTNLLLVLMPNSTTRGRRLTELLEADYVDEA